MKRFSILCVPALLGVMVWAAGAATPPEVGQQAPNFTLEALSGGQVTLSTVSSGGPIVLLVLRGFPGYQCPICMRQVRDFVTHGQEFAAAGATVVMVYPGPAQIVKPRAEEFASGYEFPAGFVMLLDPDYQFTNLYGLRWSQPRETAYPSTFLMDPDRTVFFRKISNSHGDRTTAEQVLAELAKHKK